MRFRSPASLATAAWPFILPFRTSLTAVLKAWVDQVVRIHRTFRSTPSGKVGLLADRPTFVIVSSGGWFTPPKARQPDFLTAYIASILATLGIMIGLFTVTGFINRMGAMLLDLGAWNIVAMIGMAYLFGWLVGAGLPPTATYIICAVVIVGWSGSTPLVSSASLQLPAIGSVFGASPE